MKSDRSSDEAKSRRNFLLVAAGTIAVAAAAPAGAEPAAGAKAETDAPLLMFGDELAAVHKEIGKVEDRFAFIHQQVRGECPTPKLIKALADSIDEQAERSGQPAVSARFLILRAEGELRKNPEAFDPTLSLAEKRATIASFKSDVDTAYDHAGYAQLEALHRDLSSLESTLVDKIYATPAESVAGLVVKLRVIDRMELWTEATPEEDFHRAFLGETLRNAEKLAKFG